MKGTKVKVNREREREKVTPRSIKTIKGNWIELD